MKYRSWCSDNPSDYLHDSINKNAASAVTLAEINFHIKVMEATLPIDGSAAEN
jgi:hypothetical protein